jgi:branched-chain amino acid transport system substrate-binding protein
MGFLINLAGACAPAPKASEARGCLAGRRSLRLMAGVAGLCVAFGLHAAELVVAHVGPFTGPLSVNGLPNYDGGKACIDEVNAAGGVNGHTFRLVREDDKYQPDETIRLLREVAQRDKPIAFINLLGSASVSAVLKKRTLEELKIPAIGVTPGADVLRNPGSPWIFHVHASDNAQLKRTLSQLNSVGLNRIAVAYQDIPFGQSGMKYIDQLAPSLKVEIVGRVPVPSAADSLAAPAAALRATQAQAYVMILVPNSGASLVRDVRSGGDKTPVYGMSYVPVAGILEKAGGANATGVGLAQVTPNTFSSSTGLVRSFHAAMDKFAAPGTAHSQLHLIGYLSCRVMVEGVRAAGASPTPERLRASMQKVRTDLGGYFLDFTEGNDGARYVDIGVITKEGRLLY